MSDQLSDNERIARWMGFKFHEIADIDYSDCGGIYTRKDVYSKVEIPMDKYYDADQFYIRDEDWAPEIGDVIYGTLKYDTSWEWLMPVVQKIERIKGVHCVISEVGCDIYFFGNGIYAREETKIKTVYKAVLEFIEWHESQETNKVCLRCKVK